MRCIHYVYKYCAITVCRELFTSVDNMMRMIHRMIMRDINYRNITKK